MMHTYWKCRILSAALRFWVCFYCRSVFSPDDKAIVSCATSAKDHPVTHIASWVLGADDGNHAAIPDSVELQKYDGCGCDETQTARR